MAFRMARQSEDREDLLRDATAFPTRVQLRWRRGEVDTVVFAGFRANGAASIYINQDPVYHFNTNGQLRRAFVEDLLIKAEAGRLVRWHRRQGEGEVVMVREEMSKEAQDQFAHTAIASLHNLRNQLAQRDFQIDGQVHPDHAQSALTTLVNFLKQQEKIEIAAHPGLAD